MAKVFLDAGDVFLISGPATIFGSTGVEKLQIASGATGVQLDSAVERIELAGASTAYNYKIEGTQITVYSGATAVASFAGGNNPTLAFSNGSAAVAMTGLGTATLGGVAIPAVAGPITPAVNAADPSTVPGGTTPVTPLNFALTTGVDTPAMTTANDVITGTDLTYQTNDVISDPSSTDADTLTVNVTAGTSTIATTPLVFNVENTAFNFTSFTVPTIDAANLRNGVVTVNQNQVAGNTGAVMQNLGAVTFKAGTGITGTLDLGFQDGVTSTVDAGNATVITNGATGAGNVGGTVNVSGSKLTTVTLASVTTGSATVTGDAITTATVIGKTLAVTTAAATSTINIDGAGTADSATLALGAAATVANGAANTVETLTISGNGVNTAVQIDTAAATTYTLAGTKNVTLKDTQGAAVSLFSGKTVTSTGSGTNKVELTLAAANDNTEDLTKVAVAVDIKGTAGAGDTLSVANNATINAAADTTADLEINGVAATAATNVLNLGIGAAQAAGITVTNTKTINLNVTADANINVLAAGTADVTIAGSKNLTLAATSVAATLNGATTGYTGILTATANAGALANITGGSGNDVITFTTAAAVTVDGGAGTADSAIFGANATAAKFSNFEILTIADAGTDFLASQISGSTAIVKGTNGTDDFVQIGVTGGQKAIDTQTIDLSKLVLDTTNLSGFKVTGSDVSDLLGVGSALTITTTAIADTVDLSGNSGTNTVNAGAGGDSIVGGSGADTITGGEGADTITGGAGNDSIILTETTSAIDKVIFSAHGTNGIDTITGFRSTDIFDVSDLGDGSIGAAATAVTTAATQRTLADNTSVVITATGAAASITTGGTKAITDFTNLTQVAEFLAEGFLSAVGANTEANVFVFNVTGANTTYIYSFDSADANQVIAAAELKLVGIVSNGGTNLADANIVYA